MKIKFDICKKCETVKPIVNNTHCLCDVCNKKRLVLNKENSTFEDFIIEERIIVEKPKKRILLSKKQSSLNAKVSKLYREMADERELVCSGCGTSQSLNNSHLIPRSKRPDLADDKRNIVYHCQDKCHPLWESHDLEKMKQMLDFEQNMETIQILDQSYYNLITNAI